MLAVHISPVVREGNAAPLQGKSFQAFPHSEMLPLAMVH